MDEPVFTISAGEWDETASGSSVCLVSAGEFDVNAEADRRVREDSAPPPFTYLGRTGRCWFPKRKQRWRKG